MFSPRYLVLGPRSSVPTLCLLAALSSDALALQTPPPSNVFDDVAAVYPFSQPNAFVATDNGDWLFLGEGGSIAFVDFRGLNPSAATGGAQQDMPLPSKRQQIGTLAPLPAEMVLDPAADLSDDDVTQLPDANDANDIVYIAGGNLGLWAIEAHPGSQHENVAVRLDDSGDRDVTTQHSKRFCTSVATAKIAGVDCLIALFAKAESNVLRIYRLSDARAAMAAARASTDPKPDLGHEIAPARQTFIREHPDAGPLALMTLGRSYAVSMAVDENPMDVKNPSGPSLAGTVDVYVALMTHGLFRVRLGDGGINTTTQTQNISVKRRWGPVFGSGSVYAADDPATGSGLNSSGLPADWYANLEWRDLSRGANYSKITRDDPPHFLDVAVQSDGPNSHYLYAAVDHLNWVRFDLNDPADNWRNGITIDHHEGVPSVEPAAGDKLIWGREPEWPAPTLFELSNLDGTDARDVTYTSSVHLAEITDGGTTRTMLVAGALNGPWAHTARVKGPGFQFDQSFNTRGGISFQPVLLYGKGQITIPSSMETEANYAVTAVYDLDALAPLHPGGVPSTSTPNLTRWLPVGAFSLFVPSDQSGNGGNALLRVLHGDSTQVGDNTLQFNLQEKDNSTVCVSFFDLDPAADPTVVLPFWLRGPEVMTGRYTFGAGFLNKDSDIVLQGGNDARLYAQGLIHTNNLESGTGTLDILPQDPATTDEDERLDLGTIYSPLAQFDDPMDPDVVWTSGSIAPSNNPGGGQFMRFAKHTVDSTGPLPTVDLDTVWTIEAPLDRWGRRGRPYYLSEVSDSAYDAYAMSVLPVGEVGEAFMFGTRSLSPDGIHV